MLPANFSSRFPPLLEISTLDGNSSLYSDSLPENITTTTTGDQLQKPGQIGSDNSSKSTSPSYLFTLGKSSTPEIRSSIKGGNGLQNHLTQHGIPIIDQLGCKPNGNNNKKKKKKKKKHPKKPADPSCNHPSSPNSPVIKTGIPSVESSAQQLCFGNINQFLEYHTSKMNSTKVNDHRPITDPSQKNVHSNPPDLDCIVLIDLKTYWEYFTTDFLLNNCDLWKTT